MSPGAVSHKASPPLGLSDPEGMSGLQRGCCRVQHVLLWEVLPAGGGRQEGRRLALLSRCQPTPRYWAQGGKGPLLSVSVRWNSVGTGQGEQAGGTVLRLTSLLSGPLCPVTTPTPGSSLSSILSSFPFWIPSSFVHRREVGPQVLGGQYLLASEPATSPHDRGAFSAWLPELKIHNA